MPGLWGQSQALHSTGPPTCVAAGGWLKRAKRGLCANPTLPALIVARR